MIKFLNSVFWGLLVVMLNSHPAVGESQPLSKFTSEQGPVRLTSVQEAFDLFLPVASTVLVENAVLNLRYVNSRSLTAGRSTLSVRLNEGTVAQIPLNPGQPTGTASVRLPADLWRAGFNQLTLDVVQHYTNVCEDPDAPELWTEINLAESTIDVMVQPKNEDYSISDLSGLFSPGVGGAEIVKVLTPPDVNEVVSEQALPQIAQALSLRRDFAPLTITVGDAIRGSRQNRENSRVDQTNESGEEVASRRPDDPPSATSIAEVDELPAEWGYDTFDAKVHILVGTTAELMDFLEPDRLLNVDGPHVTIDSSGAWARVIVTGPTAEDVVSAARNLGRIQDPLNPSKAITFRTIEDIDKNVLPVTQMSSEGLYDFATLGTNSRTFVGAGTHRMDVKLPVPPDFYTHESAPAELLLDFGYGAGVGPGSLINVLLNGELIHGISMDNPNGASFRDYRITLTASQLNRGDNILQFQVNLSRFVGPGECVSIGSDNMIVQIFGSSTFEMPVGGSATVLPDLKLFSSNGYPFASSPSAIIVINDEALRGAALTLVGKLTQVSGKTGTHWRIVTEIPDKIDEPAIILSSADRLKPDIFRDLSVAIGNINRWPYATLQDLRQSAVDETRSVGQRGLDLLKAKIGTTSEATPSNTTRFIHQESDLGSLGVLTAFENPFVDAPNIMVVITAADNETLIERMNSLISPGVWSQLRESLAIWSPEEEVHVFNVSEPFVIAQDDLWLLVRLLLSNNPIWWIVAASFVGLLVVFSSTVLLRKRAKRLAEAL